MEMSRENEELMQKFATLNEGMTKDAVKRKSENPTEAPKKPRGRPPKAPPVPTLNRTAPAPQPPKKVNLPPPVKDSINREYSKVLPNAKKPEAGNVEKTDEYKRSILRKILKYHEYFPALHQEYPPNLSINSSVEQLEYEYERCRNDLTNDQAINNAKRADRWINIGIERVLTHLGYNAYGLAHEAISTQHLIENELKMFSVEYEYWLTTGPLANYLQITGLRIMQIIDANDKNPGSKLYRNPAHEARARHAESNGGLSEEVKNRYSDL